MARKIILKDNGLNGEGNAPSGYSYLGKNGTTLSEKIGATVSVIGGSEWTETIVNISSSQILNMGSTPIQLMPAPGVGKYYEISKIIIEYKHNNFNYSLGGANPLTQVVIMTTDSFLYSFIETTLLTEAEDKVCDVILYNVWARGTLSENYKDKQGYVRLNNGITLSGQNDSNNPSDNPTFGDGTMRVKIYHKTITFGS